MNHHHHQMADIHHLCDSADQLFINCAPQLEALMEAQSYTFSQVAKMLLSVARSAERSALEQQLVKKLEVAKAHLRTLEAENKSLQEKLSVCQRQLRKTHKALEFQTKRSQYTTTPQAARSAVRLAPPEFYECEDEHYQGKKAGLLVVRDPVTDRCAPDGAHQVIAKTP